MSFVRFAGQYWYNSGLNDYRGWFDLWSLSEDGVGVTAEPSKVRPAEPHQIKAINWFLEKGLL